MSERNWTSIKAYEDITFNYCDGIARIAFNRPEVRNAFRPKTVDEMLDALIICHESQETQHLRKNGLTWWCGVFPRCGQKS